MKLYVDVVEKYFQQKLVIKYIVINVLENLMNGWKMKFFRVQAPQTYDDEHAGHGIIRINLEKIVAYWKCADDDLTKIMLVSGDIRDINIKPEQLDELWEVK